MKSTSPWRLALACATLLVSAVCSAQSNTQSNTPKLKVTASFSIVGDFVQVVGGERVEVTTLVGPDQDAHGFEPRPADARRLLQSRLVVGNGLGFETWLPRLVKSAGYRGAYLEATQGVVPRTLPGPRGGATRETDPHAWQDPLNAIASVRNIAAALSRLDAPGAPTYQRNADAYIQQLQDLDAWAQTTIATVPPGQRKVITSHDAFGYFAAHYGITFLAPQGLSTDREPGAKAVATLIRQIQREKIRAVFLENMTNPRLIGQIAKDTGVTLGAPLYVDALSAPGTEAASYLQLMRHNVLSLVQGMQKNAP